jgi:hypothetical protein
MSSEQLTLVAQVLDKFSAPMRQMSRELGIFDERGRRVHVDGVKMARLHAKEYQELTKQTREVARTVKDFLTPTMAVLGVGAISAGAALAGLTKSIFDFGESAKSLKFLRTETGLTINELRGFHGIAAIIGTTNEQLDQGFRKAKEILDQWQRWHVGPILDFSAHAHNMPGLGAHGAEDLKDMAERIRVAGGGIRAEMKEIFAMLDRISSEPEKRAFLSTFGFDPNLARMSAAERSKYLAQALADMGSLSDAQIKAGEDADKAWTRLKNTMQGFKEQIDAETAPAFEHMTNVVREFFNLNGAGLKKVLDDVLVGSVAGVTAFGLEIGDLAVGFGKLADAADRLAAIKIPEWIKGLPHALREGILGKEGAAEAEDREQWFKEGMPKQQKQSYHGAGVGAGGGLIQASYRQNSGDVGDAGGLGGGPEAIIFRAVLRGSWQGSRQGFIDAAHYLRDEGSGRFGGGATAASYHPGGEAGEGGVGGGYGGVGGGAGGTLGGGGGLAVHGHGGQRAILGGGVHGYAAGVGRGGGNARAAYDLIKQAGGTNEEATTLAGIAGAESRYNPAAHNTKGRDNSYGLWQINMLGAMGPERRAKYGLKSNEDLKDPATNARVALAMHRAAGGYRDFCLWRL